KTSHRYCINAQAKTSSHRDTLRPFQFNMEWFNTYDSSFLSQDDFGNNHLFVNDDSYNTFNLSTDADHYNTFNLSTDASSSNAFNLSIDAGTYNTYNYLSTKFGPSYNSLFEDDNLEDDFGNDFLSINDIAARDDFRTDYISSEASLGSKPDSTYSKNDKDSQDQSEPVSIDSEDNKDS
ncbi:21597_t:CDS:2, partial [Dentiscutata erythropus]